MASPEWERRRAGKLRGRAECGEGGRASGGRSGQVTRGGGDVKWGEASEWQGRKATRGRARPRAERNGTADGAVSAARTRVAGRGRRRAEGEQRRCAGGKGGK